MLNVNQNQRKEQSKGFNSQSKYLERENLFLKKLMINPLIRLHSGKSANALVHDPGMFGRDEGIRLPSDMEIVFHGPLATELVDKDVGYFAVHNVRCNFTVLPLGVFHISDCFKITLANIYRPEILPSVDLVVPDGYDVRVMLGKQLYNIIGNYITLPFFHIRSIITRCKLT